MFRCAEVRGAATAMAVAGMLLAAGLVVPAAGDQTIQEQAVHEQSWPLVAHVYDLRSTTVDASGTAKVSSSSGVIDATLDANVAFAKDSATLTPAAIRRLAELATQLRQAGPGVVQIYGYTDNLGTQAHGLVLSRQRAQAVAAQLPGLSGYQVTVKGMGEADPIAPNSSETSRARNRRVEVHYRRAG